MGKVFEEVRPSGERFQGGGGQQQGKFPCKSLGGNEERDFGKGARQREISFRERVSGEGEKKNTVTESDKDENTVIEGDKNIVSEVTRKKNIVSEGDKRKNIVSDGDNIDKRKGVVIEESGDGERVDWDRDDEYMRETEECVADFEDDLFDGDESVDYDQDDECFDENADKETEWVGILQDDFEDEMRFDNDDHTDGDNGEFDSEKNSDEQNATRVPVFCLSNTFDPGFTLGMKFSHKKEFQEAVHSHAIMIRRNLEITRKDKRRVYARCKANGCSWHINALKIRDELGFQIREYNHVHNCGASFHVKNARINWLSERDDTYTFISDKQKDLLPAFEKVLPGVENRFCVRHLHGNMKTAGFKGLGYKKALWFAAKTTTVSQFHKAMQDIAYLDVRCLEWLQDKFCQNFVKSDSN
ncbi:UNVERIFIED_CONTAM: hypothetical protein Sradi_3586000 [Sesamum radiatum]|uniref:Transposase MuDR plant domain-containing protein n=1 Tax=Sesamum radiatum TaxID=300843 RepID=A0AAW2QGD2_SESRA